MSVGGCQSETSPLTPPLTPFEERRERFITLYQIIHTFEGFLENPQLDGMTVLLGKNEEAFRGGNADELLRQRLDELSRGGIDGLLVNVGGKGYLESKEGWELFLKGIRAATEKGFALWIYDEKGYPSGSAGGYVLKNHPEYEALAAKKMCLQACQDQIDYVFPEKTVSGIIRVELLFDNSGLNRTILYSDSTTLPQWTHQKRILLNEKGLRQAVVYYIGTAYEWTHACNSYAEARRYINLLDSSAVREFVRVTHERYAKEIPADVFKRVEAFFTDEPSLMTVALPSLAGTATEEIPVMDPVDSRVPLLPVLPYSRELEEALRETYGAKLEDWLPELFSDAVLSGRKVKFWETVSKVYERSFAETLQHGCEGLGKLLTGHILCEEQPILQTAYHGNPLRVLKHFDLPGVDLLSNHLEDFDIFGQKLPASAAWLAGREGIMSETSDFDQERLFEKKPVTAEEMTKALIMQYLIGVRRWSYYYNFTKRTPEEYAKANTAIKRMARYGEGLRSAPEMVVYCPYESIWAGYRPDTALQNELTGVQHPSLSRLSQVLRTTVHTLFYDNYQFELCDESSVGAILEKNIRNVLIPEGELVSGELMAAARDNQVVLYGKTPKCCLEQGAIRKWDPSVPVTEGLPPKREYPVETGEGLLMRVYQDQNYLVYNVSEKEARLKVKADAAVYHPVSDVKTLAAAGDVLCLSPGEAVFISDTII